MRTTVLHAIQCQVTRRVTRLDQAWSWASAIHDMAASTPCTVTFPMSHAALGYAPARPLEWLVMEMAWICEDLEDAGACPSEVDIQLPCINDPAQAQGLIEAMLERLESTANPQEAEASVLAEAQARARACRLALEVQPRGSWHPAKAA